MPTIEIKRGDTFDLECTAYESLDGPARSLAGWSIRSQVRSQSGALLTELVVTMTDVATGSYRLSLGPGSNTSTWSVGVYAMDIEYTDPDGVIQSTETLAVSVIRDETR
jgi:hypothetical protein